MPNKFLNPPMPVSDFQLNFRTEITLFLDMKMKMKMLKRFIQLV